MEAEIVVAVCERTNMKCRPIESVATAVWWKRNKCGSEAETPEKLACYENIMMNNCQWRFEPTSHAPPRAAGE